MAHTFVRGCLRLRYLEGESAVKRDQAPPEQEGRETKCYADAGNEAGGTRKAHTVPRRVFGRDLRKEEV